MQKDTTTQDDLYHALLLYKKPNVGSKTAKILVDKFGSAKEALSQSVKELSQVKGIGPNKAKAILSEIDNESILKELQFIKKNNINTITWNDPRYPKHLEQVSDAPFLLFSKGNFNLNHQHNIAIVGTRKNTLYGRESVEHIIDGLKGYDVQVLSGLAYGIDVIAHKKSIEVGLPTVGIVAHGLDTIYPSDNTNIARSMLNNGGIMTEYMSGTQPERQNFPMRNRIVAGMSQVVLVVESAQAGGSMITAKLAASYHREVGAIPGRINDQQSAGCNYLIQTNIASMINNAEDIINLMGLDTKEQKVAQAKLFNELTDEEHAITKLIESKEMIHIDDLMLKSGMQHSQIAAILLQLEFQDIIRSVSGKRYKLKK